MIVKLERKTVFKKHNFDVIIKKYTCLEMRDPYFNLLSNNNERA